MRAAYPDIEVRHISSDHAARSAATIFRYDDNVQFVKEQVLPVVDAYRTEALAQHGEDWAKRLHLTISLADGAPARISALNASLRSYRPDYLHIWRMKTYWDSQVLCEEDVEFHSFKKLEMRPPIHRTQLPAAERAMVEEMIKYKRQFEAVRDLSMHELGSFWLRKTHKVVMAVLLTQKNGQPPVYWRGMNVEVSMPTGTCAPSATRSATRSPATRRSAARTWRTSPSSRWPSRRRVAAEAAAAGAAAAEEGEAEGVSCTPTATTPPRWR